jgi:charged multivesicular body protein 3
MMFFPVRCICSLCVSSLVCCLLLLLHPCQCSAAGINREEDKVKKSIKAAAKRGDLSTAKTLAREIVRSQKAVNRLHTSKAQMNSVMMQMENQMAQQKVTGHMSKSTEVMKMMNKLTRVAEVSETMRQLQAEMTKAGIIEEMVDGAMEGLEASDDEDAADEEVNKVMTELNAETFSGAASAPMKPVAQAEVEAVEDEDDEAMSAMRDRLAQIKST